jgi:serine/threonine protein kinase
MSCPICGKPTVKGIVCATCHAPTDPWLGRLVGGCYLVQKRIGLGGHSAVYQANDQNTQQLVALKILRQDLPQSPESIERFRREATILSQLIHPSISKIIAHGEEGGVLWLVMELLQGETLDARLNQKAIFTGDELLALLAPRGEALQLAHERQIYHRDIKPQNIFLCATSERVVLLDFDFLQKACEADKRAKPEVSPKLERTLQEYDWPGNIRELENETKRLVALTPVSLPLTADRLSARVNTKPQHAPLSSMGLVEQEANKRPDATTRCLNRVVLIGGYEPRSC